MFIITKYQLDVVKVNYNAQSFLIQCAKLILPLKSLGHFCFFFYAEKNALHLAFITSVKLQNIFV